MKQRKIRSLILPLLLATLSFGFLASCGTNPSINSTINQHFEGEGTPQDSFGNNGDTYTDLITNNEYVKVSGHWILIGNSNHNRNSRGWGCDYSHPRFFILQSKK